MNLADSACFDGPMQGNTGERKFKVTQAASACPQSLNLGTRRLPFGGISARFLIYCRPPPPRTEKLPAQYKTAPRLRVPVGVLWCDCAGLPGHLHGIESGLSKVGIERGPADAEFTGQGRFIFASGRSLGEFGGLFIG